ncbi:MAG: Light-independent protochlorophyllide reductase iron-sulfur ATP-binding protein [Dehalococcoidia bacterium]|nr:Light-independent protochlorophyllide reductase iron-sulfur ATP-binding protein [Bacillota bacterium]
MKIAVSGKGGVGKTTLVAALAKLFAEKGQKVFAIDADPDANLALTLGFPLSSQITPLIKMEKLIEERTGTKVGDSSPYFKLNPRVDDIPDRFFVSHQGINLAVMGTVRGGGLGCTCPENAFLKALLLHLIVERKEVVLLDMEAGIEHLGRGTVSAVDWLIIVAEPSLLSIETSLHIKNLAGEIGIKKIGVVGNKIDNKKDRKFIADRLKGLELLGFLSYYKEIKDAGLKGLPIFETCPELLKEGKAILNKLQV